MSVSNKKYLDPSGVLQSIVDDQGQPMTIGDEKDIREFNDVLLSRIRNAFDSKKKEAEEMKQAVVQQPAASTTSVENDVPTQPENIPPLVSQSSFMEKIEPEEEKKDVPLESINSNEADKVDEIDQTFIGKVKQLIEFQDKNGH